MNLFTTKRFPIAPLCLLNVLLIYGLLLGQSNGQEAKKDAPSYFGSQQSSEAALIGIFYDFKQTQQHLPMRRDYFKVVAEFMKYGWDEGILNQFYRVTHPLYATSVFIPYIDAAKLRTPLKPTRVSALANG
jgi:hypothetical protein